MQTLRDHGVASPRSMPTVDDVPKAAGNNWNDNAFKTAHKRKQFFGVDQPNEPPERPVFKVGKNVDLSTPDVPLAASLNEVYQVCSSVAWAFNIEVHGAKSILPSILPFRTP